MTLGRASRTAWTGFTCTMILCSFEISMHNRFERCPRWWNRDQSGGWCCCPMSSFTTFIRNCFEVRGHSCVWTIFQLVSTRTLSSIGQGSCTNSFNQFLPQLVLALVVKTALLNTFFLAWGSVALRYSMAPRSTYRPHQTGANAYENSWKQPKNEIATNSDLSI